MNTGIDKEKMAHYKALAELHLGDPVKLRLATVGALLVLTIGLVYIPFSRDINNIKKLYSIEKERYDCITDCEKLQKQAELYEALIAEKSDTNEWVNFLLDGLRKFKVKLRGMESKQQRKVGPYRAAAFSMEIEGSYPQLETYVEWLESSDSLVRIDSMQFEKKPAALTMKILVLGVVPKK
jgi:hypothetical protein